MVNKKIFFCFLLLIISFLETQTAVSQRQPLYAGIIGGGGSTTWYGLVPRQNNQNLALGMSTPIRAQEGGPVWGLLAGFEFTPFFAFESNYIHYPKAEILFDESSLFSFNHDGLIQFYSKTESLNFMGKVMLVVPDTHMRIYSSAGIANVHREDLVMDNWRTSPSFSVGFNYLITEHLLGELAGNYTSGYGESTLTPTDTYFPFLYSISVRVAYYL